MLRNGSVKGVSLALLCLILVMVPLFAGPGPVNTRGGGDSPFLYVRLEQLVAGLRAGAFPVRWMPDAAYGLGYPFFTFYAALPYYIAALFRFLGLGPITSIQLTQAIGFVLAALAMMLLARRLFAHPAAAAVAAIAYTCAPFHLVNVYVRGDSLSEFYAFVFYPLVFWALLRLRENPSRPNVAWLGLSYGGLILTHNLAAIMFSPFVAAYALFLLVARPDTSREPAAARTVMRRTFWRMLAGGILGLVLSASLWLVAAADLPAVRMSAHNIQTSGYFSYEGHLRGVDLVQPRLLFNYEVAPGSSPFTMGLVQAASIAIGLLVVVAYWLWRERRPPWPFLFWTSGLVLSTLLMTRASGLLWKHLPVLPIVQFPWRFLSVQAFFGALILGEAVQRLDRWMQKGWWWALGCALVLIAAAVGSLRPEYLPIQEADVTADRLALFESFTTNVGTTIRGEYLPVAVEPRLYASAVSLNRGTKPPPVALSGRIVQAALLAHDARSERWQIEVEGEQARLLFYTLYFPGWRARADGKAAPVEAQPNSGLIVMTLPEGEHEVVLRFGRTPVRWLADLLSLGALVVAAALNWPAIKRLRDLGWQRAGTAFVFCALVLAGLLSSGWLLSTPRWPESGDALSMDFDRMPFLHRNPQGINFGEVALMRYEYSAGTVRGGETLSVTSMWSPASSDHLAVLQLVTPADAHNGFSPAPLPLAAAEAPIDAEQIVHNLIVPEDTASGMYMLALRVFDAQQAIQALSAQGKTLGTTYLRPVWVDNPRPAQAADPVLARFGERIVLGDVQVSVSERHWDVKLTWQALRPIPINYTCSLRFLSADGRPIPGAQRDFEAGPGYGFWPTTAWPAGEWVSDRLRLPVPEGAEDAAALVVVLYDRSLPDFPAAGSAVVPLAEREHRYSAPEMEHTVGAVFGDQIALLGVDLAQDGDALRLRLHWQARRRPEADYVVFVHLYDPETEVIVAQADVRPLNGLYPTSWWREGEVIGDQVVLPLADVPAGVYALAVGWYTPGDFVRLPVVTAAGDVLPDGRLILEMRQVGNEP